MLESNPSRSWPRPNANPTAISAVLADARRWRVLFALAVGRSRRPFDDLVDAVTTAECLETDAGPWEAVRTDVAVSLHHCHVPRLAELGLLARDRDDETVEVTDAGLECAAALGVGPVG